MEEKLKEAIDKKQSDINSFVWKGEKELDASGRYKQPEIKMINLSQEDLQKYYDHCKKMLFNQDPSKPGRYLVLERIPEQRDRCGAELFLRYLEQNKGMSRFSLLSSINEFQKNNREILKTWKPTIEDVFANIPEEFGKIPLSLVIDGCLDRLGTFNKKAITRNFVLKQGIWLTPTESKELMEEGSGKQRLEIIRERLNIQDVERLSINSKGLNFTQMRAMLNIKQDRKYMDLTTTQLETLRYRILFNLEENVKEHIAFWERKMEELEIIANYRGIKL